MTRCRRILCVAIAVAAVLFVPVSPAAAHEGSGTIAVEEADPAADAAVRYVVRLTWNNDGHPAAADLTTITAVPVGADGTARTPVTLEPVDDDGRFEGTIEFPGPGAWPVRFTSIAPPATLEVPQQVAPPATTTTMSGEATSTTAGEAATSTTVDDATGDTSDDTADEDGDGGPSAAGSALFVAVLLLLAGAALVLGRRMRQRSRGQADRAERAEQADAPEGPTA